VAQGSSDAVGKLIRHLRQSAELTVQQLADAIGCSKAQLSLMESGLRTVSAQWAQRIEKALGVRDGRITAALQWQHIPPAIRAQVERSELQSRAIAGRIKQALTSDDPLAALRDLVEHSSSNVDGPLPLKSYRGIPVINKVAAGYPAEFTDLDYPASIADEYITCPDVSDADAFAARVVGDSMEPEYHEGDLVVFSPSMPTPAGSDCFVRLERDNQTTFKRVYFENEGRTIRLQPLNSAYAPQFVDREDVTGMYAAAYVMRRVRIASP